MRNYISVIEGNFTKFDITIFIDLTQVRILQSFFLTVQLLGFRKNDTTLIKKTFKNNNKLDHHRILATFRTKTQNPFILLNYHSK